MDENQKYAFNLAVNDHNLVVTGQAGTGTTFLVRKLVEYMRYTQNINVAIVCSTGIAATLEYMRYTQNKNVAIVCSTGIAATLEYMRYTQNKNVAMVCSTGIAATHYENLNA
jgi:DNA-binding transcriptional regulator LsrR (DeoR family)